MYVDTSVEVNKRIRSRDLLPDGPVQSFAEIQRATVNGLTKGLSNMVKYKGSSICELKLSFPTKFHTLFGRGTNFLVEELKACFRESWGHLVPDSFVTSRKD